MRANISYSVELEDIPEEVNKLILETEKLHGAVVTMYESVPSSLDSGAIIPSIAKIDEARQNLASIDIRLQECVSILSGYQKVLVDLQNDTQSEMDSEAPE